MSCGKQSHFAKNCKAKGPSIVTNWLKGTQKPQNTEKLKGTRGYMLKHFTFCYNDKCPVYEEVKYGASYWPQEFKLEQLKGTKKTNRL